MSRFTDYKEMVERCALDVVAVATDSGSHSEIALYCLSRGISVLVEKPMALSIEDADAMIATAAEQGVFLGVCQQNRLNDSTLLVKEALDRGAFGTLSHVSVQVRWWRDKSYYEQAPWRGTWEQDGGALMNQCIHGFDLMRLFGGEEITEVSGHIANRTHPYLEVEDVGVGYVRFAGGAIGTFEGTTSLYEKNLEERITLIGETGTVVLAGESAQDIEVWHFKDPEVMALLTSFDPTDGLGVWQQPPACLPSLQGGMRGPRPARARRPLWKTGPRAGSRHLQEPYGTRAGLPSPRLLQYEGDAPLIDTKPPMVRNTTPSSTACCTARCRRVVAGKPTTSTTSGPKTRS